MGLEGAPRLGVGLEGAAADELQGEGEAPRGDGMQRVGGHEVGVVQPLGERGLALEAGAGLRVAEQVAADDLEGNGALRGPVGGAVDDGHPAAPEFLVEDVRRPQRLLHPRPQQVVAPRLAFRPVPRRPGRPRSSAPTGRRSPSCPPLLGARKGIAEIALTAS